MIKFEGTVSTECALYRLQSCNREAIRAFLIVAAVLCPSGITLGAIFEALFEGKIEVRN